MRTDMRKIRRFALEVARRFRPERIILFGSYAQGRATRDSDVDILVVMPTHLHPADEAVRIRQATKHPFPLDLLVRPPEMLKKRTRLGDPFLLDVIQKGRILYERTG